MYEDKKYVGKSRIELENTKKKSLKDTGARRAEIEMVFGKPALSGHYNITVM